MLLGPSLIVALAFIGLGDTLFLSYFQYMNAIPGCAIGGCEQVLTSVYSKFFGVSLSYIGLVYYVGMLALGIVLSTDPRSFGLRWATVAYATIGLGLSIYFEFYIQMYLIGALCMYCAISALVTLAFFSVAVQHYKATRDVSHL